MKYLIAFCLILTWRFSIAQRVMEDESALDDSNLSWGHSYFGAKVFAGNYSYQKYPDPLFFQFKSATSDFIIQKDLSFGNLSKLYMVGLGLEYNSDKRLYTNLNVAFCAWPANAGAVNFSGGAGYIFSLRSDDRVLLRPYVNLAGGYVKYTIGTNFQNDKGIILNGKDVGTAINDIYYFNNNISVVPSCDIVYQTMRVNLFLGLGYYIPFESKEVIDFRVNGRKNYKFNCNNSDFIYDYSGHTLHENIVQNINFIQLRFGVILTVRG